MKTEYVFGLFEGGGAKGVAYAGAIEACDSANIWFEGACGVSAGSIAAALVSAGLPAHKVSDLLKTGIPEILAVPGRSWVQRSWRSAKRRGYFRGLHSTEGIAVWLEGILREALGVDRQVTFGDMPRPLAILAYNRKAKSAHVWDSVATKGESVSFAVSASCSIPLYFEATSSGDASYFDGGIVENAPAFLISRITRNASLPTLAFRLTGSDQMLIKKRWVGPIDRLMEHVGDIIDARAEVTRPAAMEIRDIRIDCGNVGSTDFVIDDLVRNALLSAGRAAVQEYLVQREDSTFSIPARDQLFASGVDDIQLSRAKHEALDRTGRLIDAAQQSVSIFAGDTTWLESLAPYLLLAERRKLGMRLITSSADPLRVEQARHLGIAVGILQGGQALRGTMIDAGGDNTAVIAVEPPPNVPMIYRHADAPKMCSHFADIFERLWGDSYILDAIPPELRRLEITEIERALMLVPQYENIRISIEYLKAVNVLPSSKFVETFKLARLARVQELYDHADSQKGYHIKGTPWFSIWPVVERRPDGRLVVIDGTHRFYSSYVRDEAQWCIVVNGCTAALPSNPAKDWDHVRLTTAKLPREERFENYNAVHFRPLKAVLSNYFTVAFAR